MLILLFQKQGVIRKKLVSDGKIVNNEFYIQMLERLLKGISRVRPQFWEKGSWSLLNNSALAHSTITVNCSLGNHSMVLFTWPHDRQFFLFPKVKTRPQRKKISGCHGHLDKCNCQVKCSLLHTVSDHFVQLLEKCKKCVAFKRFLWRKIKTLIFYFMCISSYRRSPVTLFLMSYS